MKSDTVVAEPSLDQPEQGHRKRPIVQESLSALKKSPGISMDENGEKEIIGEEANGEHRQIEGEDQEEEEDPTPALANLEGAFNRDR